MKSGLLYLFIFLLHYLFVPSIYGCSAILTPIKEVIKKSDVILRAKAVASEAEPNKGTTKTSRVILKVNEVIKGDYQEKTISVPGKFNDYELWQRRIPYNQLTCSRAMGCGGCYAVDYMKGHEYLLILKDGTPSWAPLSPTNEDISGDDDPWVKWVKREVEKLTTQ